MAPEVQSFLKDTIDCPCGCGAHGVPTRKTGHPKSCVESCRTCAWPKATTSSTTRIPEKVRRQVRSRSGGRCEFAAAGRRCPRPAEHMHHKRRKGQGGGDTASNLVDLCWLDHQFIHDNPEVGYQLGYLIASTPEPNTSAVVSVEKVDRG